MTRKGINMGYYSEKAIKKRISILEEYERLERSLQNAIEEDDFQRMHYIRERLIQCEVIKNETVLRKG